ncbi:MAG: hypothetical protein QXU73_07550 [Thermoplasmata archaeon]
MEYCRLEENEWRSVSSILDLLTLESDFLLEEVESRSSLVGSNGDIWVISGRNGITASGCEDGFEGHLLPTNEDVRIREGPWEHACVPFGIQEEGARTAIGFKDPDLGQIALYDLRHPSSEIRLDLPFDVLTKSRQ